MLPASGPDRLLGCVRGCLQLLQQGGRVQPKGSGVRSNAKVWQLLQMYMPSMSPCKGIRAGMFWQPVHQM